MIMWRAAGFLAASVVLALLGYILFCIVGAIAKEVRKGRDHSDR